MKREDLKNNVRIVGELINKEVRRNNVDTANETIALELTVRVSEVEQHQVFFFAYKYGKNQDGIRVKDSNKISKLYMGYDTVANEYRYKADENGEGFGEVVDIKGSLAKNMYVDKQGAIKEIVKIKGIFCSRTKGKSESDYGTVWEAHVHITDMKEDATDKTGEYVLVKGMVVGYTEEEFEFRIYREKAKVGFVKRFDIGDSLRLVGELVNRPDEVEVETETDTEEGWGEEVSLSASSNTIIRKYLEIVSGDTSAMDTDDEEHPLNIENIKQYRKNINRKKQDLLTEYEEKQKEEKNSFDFDDIPF